MRTRSPRTPPPSSYSHAPHHTPAINVHEIASRIGLQRPEESASDPRSSLCYISLLPPEILAEIFIQCIPEGQFPLPYRTEAPLLLTHVSSQWRSLAISTPELWTALHINYKDPTEDVPATNVWLARSGNKPLSLSVAIDFSERPQQEILDALCRHSKRWKHIRFEFRNLFCPPMYSLDMAMNDIEELATFEFHARDISTINVSPITNLLSTAPKLREVTWVDDLADTDTLLQLPLGRLTRLSLSMDNGILDYRQVLNACYNLEHIRLTKPFSLPPHIHEPLLLPKLTSVNITSGIAGVLDHLVLPALREVRIHGESDRLDRSQALGHDVHPNAIHHPHTGTWDPTPLLSLIQRSACSITRLSVSPPMTEAALLMCLRGMSATLVTLCVEGIPIGDTLLQALTCRGGEQGAMPRVDSEGVPGARNVGDDVPRPLCPVLEEMIFDTRVGCTPGMLVSMVESRLTKSEAPGTLEHEHAHCQAMTDTGQISSLISIAVVDGHKDLARLKALDSALKSRGHAAQQAKGPLVLKIIPRKTTKPHTRDYLFRRKLCASR